MSSPFGMAPLWKPTYTPTFGSSPSGGSSFGMPSLSSFLGGAVNLGSQLVGQLFADRNAGIQYKYAKQLADYEMKLQKDLIKSQPLLQKQALQQAGFSVASMNGNFSPVSAPSGSYPGIITPSTGIDASSMFSNFVNAQGQGIENLFKSELLSNEVRISGTKADEVALSLKLAQQTFSANVATVYQNLDNLVATGRLTQKQAEQAQATISNLAALTRGISIDNRFKAKLNQSQIDKIAVEIGNLSKDGRYKEVVANLAEHGIIINADWLTQLAALSQQGGLHSILSNLGSQLSAMFGEVGNGAVASWFEAILKNIGKGAFDAGKRVTDYGKRAWDAAIKGIENFFKPR